MKKRSYDTKACDFAEVIRELFNCDDLTNLHNMLPDEISYKELHKLGEDNKTWFHQVFYKPINEGNSKFQELYEKFIFEVLSEHLDFNKFLYQKSPTFRVHIPDNIAVGGWHRDRDYNHSPDEINFFLPLTKAFESNTIWAETEEDRGDYTPMECNYGEFYIWNGANLRHGNKVNKTGISRVSVDFRILPYHKYNPENNKKSVAAGRSFTLGDYYELFER